MSKIYSRASHVVVWAGNPGTAGKSDGDMAPRDRQAHRSFSAVCVLANMWLRQQGRPTLADYSSYGDEPGSEALFDKDKKQALDETLEQLSPSSKHTICKPGDIDALPWDSPFWQALSDLFARDWFWRIWVIQEVVVARKAVMRLDGVEISWDWIGLAVAVVRNSFSANRRLGDMRGVYNAYLMYRLRTSGVLPAIHPTFLQMLRLTRQFETSEPRDRVYGLLGLQLADNNVRDGGELLVHPDYSISTTALWKKFFWKHVQQHGDLAILNSVQYQAYPRPTRLLRRVFDNVPAPSTVSNNQACEHLPSWVPNWSKVYRTTLLPWASDETFSASKGMPLHLCSAEPTESPDRLSVEGICVSEVVICRDSVLPDDRIFGPSSPLGGFLSTNAGFQLLARTLVADKDQHGLLQTEEAAVAGFAAHVLDHPESLDPNSRRWHANTPFAERMASLTSSDFNNRMYKYRAAARSSHAAFLAQARTLAIEGHGAGFETAQDAACSGRSFFLTANGYFGLGPDCVQEGDLLCILAGGQTPFLLRPSAAVTNLREDMHSGAERYVFRPRWWQSDHTPETVAQQTYVLVGECYVADLMRGEAVEICDAKHRSSNAGPVPLHVVDKCLEASLALSDSLGRTERQQRMPEKAGFGKLLQLLRERYEIMKAAYRFRKLARLLTSRNRVDTFSKRRFDLV